MLSIIYKNKPNYIINWMNSFKLLKSSNNNYDLKNYFKGIRECWTKRQATFIAQILLNAWCGVSKTAQGQIVVQI